MRPLPPIPQEEADEREEGAMAIENVPYATCEIRETSLARSLTAEEAQRQERAIIKRGRNMGVLAPDTLRMLEDVYWTPARATARAAGM